MAAIIRLCATFFTIAILASCASDTTATRGTSWPDGAPREEWTATMNKNNLEVREGYYKSWNEDGHLAKQGSYRSGVKDGLWTIWQGTAPNVKIMEGEFVEGEMDGRWYFWMNPSHMAGSEQDSMTHQMGGTDHKLHGFVHPEPFKFAEYKMGVPHGLSLSQHHNGQVADSFVYVNGKLEGKYISYHPNGQRATVAKYKNGVRQEKQLFWDEDGTVVSKIE